MKSMKKKVEKAAEEVFQLLIVVRSRKIVRKQSIIVLTEKEQK